MKMWGQAVRSTPTVPTADECELRARLIIEEAFEHVEALGVEIWDAHGKIDMGMAKVLRYRATQPAVLHNVAKEACDQIVVATGTLSACGLGDAGLLKMVDESNLAKAGGGVDENGKGRKPEGWKKPDIEGYIEKLKGKHG